MTAREKFLRTSRRRKRVQSSPSGNRLRMKLKLRLSGRSLGSPSGLRVQFVIRRREISISRSVDNARVAEGAGSEVRMPESRKTVFRKWGGKLDPRHSPFRIARIWA